MKTTEAKPLGPNQASKMRCLKGNTVNINDSNTGKMRIIVNAKIEKIMAFNSTPLCKYAKAKLAKTNQIISAQVFASAWALLKRCGLKADLNLISNNKPAINAAKNQLPPRDCVRR